MKEKVESIEKHVSLKMMKLFMKCIGLWYPENSRQLIISNLLLLYTINSLIIALIIMVIDFYHIKSDLRAVAFNLPCTLTVIQELFKVSRFARYIDDVRYLNSLTVNKFWKFKYESPDLFILQKYNRISFVSCGTFFLFILAIDMHYIMMPVIEYDKSVGRKLPFRMYFAFNERTPWFELFYVIEAACIIGVTICTTAFISHLFTITMYAAGQFQILQRKISITCNNSMSRYSADKSMDIQESTFKKLKQCIKQHQMLIDYMKAVANLYSPITCLLALAAVCTICLTGFQLVVGVNTGFHRNALSIEFFLATIIMLFMACYSCEEIIVESLAVSDASYFAYATYAGLSNIRNRKIYMQPLLFLMMRSRKPCMVECFASPMCIGIFTAVFNKSMSFFAVLRQMLEESNT